MLNLCYAWPSAALLTPGVIIDLCLSVATLAVGVAIYRIFHKRLLPPISQGRGRLIRDRLVMGGIALMAVMGLIYIWQDRLPVLAQLHAHLAGTAESPESSMYARIVFSLVAATVVYLLTHTAQHAAINKADDLETKHKFRRLISRIGVVVFVFVALNIWVDSNRLLDSLGLFGAGLALALHESLLCIAGWVLVTVQKPFDIGDRIEVDQTIGDVIDIRVFQTSLLEVGNWVHADQSTGRIINIPNSTFFRQTCANYTKGFPFIWNELTVVVTFESDWLRSKEILLTQAAEEAEKIEDQVREQLTRMQQQYAIRYDHLRPIVYTDVVDNGVSLTLRYLSAVRERRATTHRIWEGILEAFAAERGIDFAYPTTRFYRNEKEGKRGTGGPGQAPPPPCKPSIPSSG